MSEFRSAAAQAGICDESRLEYDVSRAFTAAKSEAELDEIFRAYIAPVEASISDETYELLSRLYSIRLSTLSWEQ